MKINVQGHVLITDVDSGQILLNRRNAIHNENMSVAIASTLTASTDINDKLSVIGTMAFGNGGVIVEGNGNVIYNETNVIETTAELYNKTYEKDVNFSYSNDYENNTKIVHTNGKTYTDIVVTCTLSYDEPQGQDPYDDTADQEGDFVFDEIGLVSQQGRLLTHLIFHPVQKSANRKIQVIYTVRLTLN